MKKQILIAALGLSGFLSYSQNSPTWPSTGNVGIGISTPGYLLHVKNDTLGELTASYNIATFASDLTGSTKDYELRIINGHNGVGQNFTRLHTYHGPTSKAYIQFGRSTSGVGALPTAHVFGFGPLKIMQIQEDGKVSIGDVVTPGDYKLYVEQGILTEKVKVAVKTTGDWADYVFAPEYQLMPLNEVEAYTKENGHLPNTPSAEEMVAEGLDVAKMDAKLLEKIEELTLYAIGQDKEIASLEEKLTKQEQELTEIKTQLKLLLENQ